MFINNTKFAIYLIFFTIILSLFSCKKETHTIDITRENSVEKENTKSKETFYDLYKTFYNDQNYRDIVSNLNDNYSNLTIPLNNSTAGFSDTQNL